MADGTNMRGLRIKKWLLLVVGIILEFGAYSFTEMEDRPRLVLLFTGVVSQLFFLVMDIHIDTVEVIVEEVKKVTTLKKDCRCPNCVAEREKKDAKKPS